MADDTKQYVYPTKEMKKLHSQGDFEIHVPDRRTFLRRTGPNITRNDLEDKFYKFKEENHQLKKAVKKQEDELKQLATKMTRLLREKKNMELRNTPGPKRVLELEEMVEDLQDNVRQLEKTNSRLRDKMIVAKHQVINRVRRPNPYSHIPPKVNSGISRSGISPYILSLSSKGKSPQSLSRKPPVAPIPPIAISLLEEARNDISELECFDIYSIHLELKYYFLQLRVRDMDHDEELNALKCQMTQRQRQHVQENLDLIRLHRELEHMQAQNADLEENVKCVYNFWKLYYSCLC
ncbi:protein fantom-like [Uloborus diversus]|uniref:protein fantom-like n=1 Tax=Uloborus diversus TaxID=327109 RepID=UPI002409D8BD|nr:protein fantom-like [Uloborus diversus]